jgi:hypothetical protein
MAPALLPEALPAGCVPDGGVAEVVALFERHPQAIRGQALGAVTCAACGCPQPWFFCVRSADRADRLLSLGYAPLD